MRLVVTSDTHTPVDPSIIPDGDVFIHAGDLMSSGTPDEWRAALEWLSVLPHKTKIYVPGNHDFHLTLYPGPAVQDMREMGFVVLGLPNNHEYQSIKLPNGMTVLGLPYVKNLDRWCFNTTEEEIFSLLHTTRRHDIVVSHAPVHGYLDHKIRGEYSGFQAYEEYLYETSPNYWFHGHIHEHQGENIKLFNTEIYNVCMSDRFNKHTNLPLVLDI
jgi:Icc-related predicted phosphoesterase